MSLRSLQQNRSTFLNQVAEQFKKETTKGEGYQDDRFWYPDVDKQGNGQAIIRFMPCLETETSPWVKVFRRSFRGPTGKWYIENDISTPRPNVPPQNDPVYELSQKILAGRKWDEAPKEIKELLTPRNRKTEYITNVYIVEDKAHPENEGKVFLFRFGPQIFGILNEKMFPTFEGAKKINPFDPFGPDVEQGLDGGANFLLRIILRDKKYRNYEKSEFADKGALFPDDVDGKKLEAAYAQVYPLQPFLGASNFKSKSELQEKLADVLGLNDDEDHSSDYATVEPALAPQVKPVAPKTTEASWDGDDDDVDENFFKALAED